METLVDKREVFNISFKVTLMRFLTLSQEKEPTPFSSSISITRLNLFFGFITLGKKIYAKYFSKA